MLREKILKWVDPFIRLPLAGLDISDSSIKYLKLGSDGAVDVELFGEVEVPAGIIVKGEIVREDDLVKVLDGLLAREGKRLNAAPVVASLPEEKSYLRIIQIPKVERDAVANAVRWEMEANIPMPLEDLVYDYEIVEAPEVHPDHLDVIITAFPKSTVGVYTRVLTEVGFLPAVLELESQAIVRALVPDLRSRVAHIIVDLGRNRTSVIVCAGGVIIFTTTVEIGGRIFEENIARALGVSAEEAAALKKEAGLSKKEREGQVFSALVPACTVIADEVRRAVLYYQGHVKHLHGLSPTVSKIFLAGGDSNLLGLDTYLASALKIETLRADPLINLKERLASFPPPFSKNRSLAYTTAIGLALRGLR